MSGRPPRLERVNQAVREVVADELALIDDDRLELLTITGVRVAGDLRHAIVWFAIPGPLDADGYAAVQGGAGEVLEEHGPRLQRAVARQLKLKRTPELRFTADPARAAATRVEQILRTLAAEEPSERAPSSHLAGSESGTREPTTEG